MRSPPKGFPIKSVFFEGAIFIGANLTHEVVLL